MGILRKASAVVLTGMVAGGCGYPDPQDPTAGHHGISGAVLTAAVYEIDAAPNVKQVGVRVYAANPTDRPVSFDFPLACPVRIRLYRPADMARVYDEALYDCDFGRSQRATIEPGTAWERASGGRFPWAIHGDSLPPGPYNAAALLMLIGEVLEIPAGVYLMPLCEEIGIEMVCSHPTDEADGMGSAAVGLAVWP